MKKYFIFAIMTMALIVSARPGPPIHRRGGRFYHPHHHCHSIWPAIGFGLLGAAVGSAAVIAAQPDQTPIYIERQDPVVVVQQPQVVQPMPPQTINNYYNDNQSNRVYNAQSTVHVQLGNEGERTIVIPPSNSNTIIKIQPPSPVSAPATK